MIESLTAEVLPKQAHKRLEREPAFLRFTGEQYHKLAEVGILQPDKRFELVNGFIYQANPVSSEHSYTVKQLYDILATCSGNNAAVFSQSPIKFSDDSEPEPDVVVLKAPSKQYRERLPEPADVLLIVEVSKTTLQFDRTVKFELYARAGIPEYWIIDLGKKRLEVYRDPDAEEKRYRMMLTFDEGQAVRSGALAGCDVAWWD